MHYLLSDVAYNISYAIPMNLSCIQERKFSEQMKSQITVSYNEGIQNQQNKELSNFLHTYCDADNARDIYY